ncbi:MAG: hypothetical protein HY319_05235 [Armatimonadetes bacterium]|nr:hypothetical protein [Armatimonadota bacterium]
MVPVAQTRVTVPPVPPRLLSRPRIRAALDEIAGYPLGLVLGGPGFGKTASLAEWAAGRPEATGWYAVAEGDNDLYTVLLHILAALHRVLRHAALLRAVERLQSDGVEGNRWRPVVDEAINAIASLTPKIVLVVDDSHRLRSDRVLEALTYLGQYLPPNLSVILGARTLPEFPAWHSWTARGRVGVLESGDLALDPGEIAELFTLRRGAPPPADEVSEVARRTGGWPLGVDFLSRKVSVRLPESNALQEYITSEIWSGRSDDEREFLLRCSVLEILSEPACRTITAREDAGKRMRAMAMEGLFMRALPDGRFTVHELFRDFLRGRLESDPESYRTCHAAAARTLLDLGQPVEAVGHLIRARRLTTARDILVQEGPGLLVQGRQERVLSLLDELEPALEAPCPWLRLARGWALRQRNDFEPALIAFEQAAALARSIPDAGLEARATLGSARVFVDTLQPARAAELLRRAFRLSPAQDAEQRAQILMLMAENAINSGRARAALRFRRWAQRLLTRPDRDVLDARLLLRTGQLHAAREHLLARLETRRDDVDRVMEAHREDVLVLAYIGAVEGDYELAGWAARSGLGLGRAGDSSFTEAVAWMRLAHAQQLDPEVGFREAVTSYQRAARLVEKTGVARLKAEGLMGLALLHAAEGNTAGARACASEGLEIMEGTGDEWLTGPIRTSNGWRAPTRWGAR